MTAAEWEALDKKPGMLLYLPQGNKWDPKPCTAGRLVSYIGYGATLDFTREERYKSVERGYYPYQMLYKTEEDMRETWRKEKEEKERRARERRERELLAEAERAKARAELGKARAGREKTGIGKGGRQRKAVKCVETGVIYQSRAKAAEAMETTGTTISKCVIKGMPLCGKWHFVNA